MGRKRTNPDPIKIEAGKDYTNEEGTTVRHVDSNDGKEVHIKVTKAPHKSGRCCEGWDGYISLDSMQKFAKSEVVPDK